MRYRLFHKPTRTVRADRYATEADAYAALGKMPFTESADYFVVVDDPTTATERAGGYRRVKVSMEIIANLTQYPSQPVTMQIVDDAGDLQFVMTRHDCAPVTDAHRLAAIDQCINAVDDMMDADAYKRDLLPKVIAVLEALKAKP